MFILIIAAQKLNFFGSVFGRLLCKEVERPEELRRVQERIWVDWLQENVFDA